MFARFSRKCFVLFFFMLIIGIFCDEEYDLKCKENEMCIHERVNKCSSDFLYCRDSMFPVCKSNVGKTLACKSSTDLAPGTTATFSCKKGFRDNGSGLTLTCQEDGTWRNSSNMENFCKLDCGQPIKGSPSRAVHLIEPPLSPWSVAIFLFDKTTSVYEHICGGVLIRHNLVLTAAHCVYVKHTRTIYESDMFRVGPSNSNTRTVSNNFGWTVKNIKTNPHYNHYSYEADTAIMHFVESNEFDFTVICLPWLNDVNLAKIQNGDNGQVATWATDEIMDPGRMNLTIVSAEVSRVNERQFGLRTINNQKICKRDSGSGFIMDGFCEKQNATLHFIYGIVSSTGHGADLKDKCTTDVTITSIEHSDNKDFIQEILDETLNTCDQI